MLSTREAVEVLMNPKKVVFVGASSSPEKTSGLAVRNLINSDYNGELFVVNQNGGKILGHEAYLSVNDLPKDIDLAFVTIPAKHTPQSIFDLAEKNVRVAIVAVGGYAELGDDNGKKLQKALTEAGRKAGVRIVGPVCNGIYNTHNSLALGYNVAHSKKLRAGSIGLVSHSGALLGPLVSAIEECGVGLSKFFSCGSEVDMCMSDYMEYLVDDPATNVIALVVDRVGDGKRFRAVLQKAQAAGKPVVALKLGDSAIGRKATLAHSSHLAGAKEAYEAVLRTEGVMRVFTLESLATVCTILATGRRAKQNSITACSTSGGGAIMLADRMSEQQMQLTQLTPETIANIGQGLRFDAASIMNPFDLGLGGRDNYQANVEWLGRDPGTGVLICYGTPMQTAAKRIQMAVAFTHVAKVLPELPVIILFPGDLEPEEKEIYKNSQIPLVTSVFEAISVANALVTTHRKYVMDADASITNDQAKARFEKMEQGECSEFESKRFLADYGVNLPPEAFVHSRQEAVDAATRIGYPVVLKACGRKIAHKSDLKLLEINLYNEDVLIKGYERIKNRLVNLPDVDAEGYLIAKMVTNGIEVIFGITRDDEFGHIAVLGPGGTLAELIGKNAMARAPLPLTREMIEEMIDMTVLSKLLAGYRGEAPGDRKALVNQVFRAAQAVTQLGDEVAALDINPILVRKEGEGAWPLDALLIKYRTNNGGQNNE